MLITNKYLTFFCVVLILAAAAGPLWGFSGVPPEPVPAPGRILVKFHDGVDPETIAGIMESEGATVKRVLTSTGVHIIVLSQGEDISDAVERFSAYPEVKYAEPVQKAIPLEEK